MTVSLNTTSGTALLIERGDYAVTAMVCNAGGLLEPTIQKLVSLQGNGSTANPLGVRLSSTAGNDLTIDGTGLYYNQTPITVTDTNCINLTASGIDGHTIQADPIISAAIGGVNNTFSCTATGMYSPEVRFVTTNTCVAGSIGAGYMVRDLSNVGLNLYRLDSAPEHTTLFNTLSYTPGGLPIVLAALGTTDLANSGTMTLNNTSACRSMVANTSIDAIAQYIVVGNRRVGLNNQILVSINGGIFTALSTNAIEVNAATGQTENTGNVVHRIVDITTLAPGGTRTFAVRHRTNTTVLAGGGSATWTAAQAFLSAVMNTI